MHNLKIFDSSLVTKHYMMFNRITVDPTTNALNFFTPSQKESFILINMLNITKTHFYNLPA